MSVTNFPNGVTNNKAQNLLGELKAIDPTKYNEYFDDFNIHNASDWTITTTEAGSGTASEEIISGDGGILKITNAAGDNDNDFFQGKESFKFTSGKPLFFKARFKVSDAIQSDFVMGLQITDTSPLDITDGVFFQKDDGDANLDFHVEKDNTATSASAIATISDDTYITVGFYYDGGSKIKYYAGSDNSNPPKLGESVIDNLPDDEELAISFGIQNGEAVAKSMSIDYIFVAKER